MKEIRKVIDMSHTMLDYSSAHAFVRDQRRKGADVRWEGWDIVFWSPTHYGFTNKNGAFNKSKGRWGMESRVTVSDDGCWKIPQKNVRAS
jgi:hypothetical protein